MIRSIARPLSLILIVSFMLLDFTGTAARAGLIGTEELLTTQRGEDSRSRITAFLDRQDVQESLQEKGIDPKQAKKSVAGLTDREVSQVCKIIDQLPAGGDGVGAVVGAILLIFVILLLTDILGFTHVFPFVKHSK